MGIDINTHAAFYITPEEKNGNEVTEAVFSDSGTGGVRENALMESPLVNAVIRVLTKRKEELGETQEQEDYSDLLDSLSDSDY